MTSSQGSSGTPRLRAGRVSEFDDDRLQGAFRAFLRAVDDVADAAADRDEAALLRAADARRLAELVLRARLTEAGWAPAERAPRSGPGETSG